MAPQLLDSWSEPAATSAPVQDEALQAVLGMNQKHILFQGFFSPLLCPKIYPFYPLHLISGSLHCKSLGELEYLEALRRRDTQGLRKVESSTLTERGEDKANEALHPKCKSRRKKVSSLPCLHFCFLFLFSFLLLEKKKTTTMAIIFFFDLFFAFEMTKVTT